MIGGLEEDWKSLEEDWRRIGGGCVHRCSINLRQIFDRCSIDVP